MWRRATGWDGPPDTGSDGEPRVSGTRPSAGSGSTSSGRRLGRGRRMDPRSRRAGADDDDGGGALEGRSLLLGRVRSTAPTRLPPGLGPPGGAAHPARRSKRRSTTSAPEAGTTCGPTCSGCGCQQGRRRPASCARVGPGRGCGSGVAWATEWDTIDDSIEEFNPNFGPAAAAERRSTCPPTPSTTASSTCGRVKHVLRPAAAPAADGSTCWAATMSEIVDQEIAVVAETGPFPPWSPRD